MPEFLVVTTRQNVVDVAKHLNSEDGIEIQVEDDFTKGLKAIFYRLPEVVFIQEEIAGITAQKVAGQVKTLLDDEPIRMVLLREQVGEWDSVEPSFDSIIDTSLSFDKLLGLFREEIKPVTAPVVSTGNGTLGREESTNDDSMSLAPWDIVQEIDPFSDMFPVQFQSNWPTVAPDAEHETRQEAKAPNSLQVSTSYSEEFCFETPGDIVSTLPTDEDKPIDGQVSSTDLSIPAANEQNNFEEGKNARHMDKVSPHQLFASINDGEAGQSDAIPVAKDNPSAPISDRLRLKGLPPQNSILKTDNFTQPSSYGVAETETLKRTTSASYKSAKDRSSRQGSSLKEFPVVSTYRENRLMRIMKPFTLLVFIALATYLLLINWDKLFHFSEDKDEIANLPQLEAKHTNRVLPPFFPSVRPDVSYSANHPGWERYPGGGIDYLVYRENGVIKAMQIIAGPDGKISEPFVRLCIRQTTGLANGTNWISRQNDGFQVETGTMGEQGEVSVYRKIPEGEIRGIVLSFK